MNDYTPNATTTATRIPGKRRFAFTRSWSKCQMRGCGFLASNHKADCESRVRRLAIAAAMLPATEPKATVNDTQ